MMKIGELAKASGLSADTLRFYEKLGLIASRRQANGYRVFPATTLQELQLLRLGQSLGFTLRELADLAPVLKAGGLDPDQVRHLLVSQAARVEDRLAALMQLRDRLAQQLQQPCPLGLPSGTTPPCEPAT